MNPMDAGVDAPATAMDANLLVNAGFEGTSLLGCGSPWNIMDATWMLASPGRGSNAACEICPSTSGTAGALFPEGPALTPAQGTSYALGAWIKAVPFDGGTASAIVGVEETTSSTIMYDPSGEIEATTGTWTQVTYNSAPTTQTGESVAFQLLVVTSPGTCLLVDDVSMIAQ